MKTVVHYDNFIVKVYNQVGIFTQELSKTDADEISNYVEQHNLGIRTAWDRWKLRDSQSVTMFTLKFNQLANS
jgi:hypothetical protein